MNHHEAFKAHLGSLPDCAELLRVCRSYKTADNCYAFELNGRLKAGLPIDKFIDDLPHLQKLICATPTSTLTLFRMTSGFEFSVPLLQALEGHFTYQAFMSTTSDKQVLRRFIPPSAAPLVLEIECPPGTALAPLDFFPGISESEYLLGCGTTFQITSKPRVLSPEEASEYAPGQNEVHLIKLKILKSPRYVDTGSLFQIDA
ncbi:MULTISPECIES: hypothetical protein [Pseudomonas]|uniref:NAD(+)--protein-arginine ADP-ribosyltransferase n=1 Tax=Pseudomonas piscis TaxID=2614538 RepID=A0ABY9NFY4_9PSED|nr:MULTISPECIES: hypothetical protein [Pseudomonas]POA59129.1 hypothetical protein C1889_01955 [Pseudomonas sp. FW507-12TSA]QIH10537.1 hypothetical protein ATY02_29315 [Pseudomonas sp. BIOMIG1BAC]WMN16618.1 hypothetical protein QL104_25200 [Pseudomonas piscis]